MSSAVENSFTQEPLAKDRLICLHSNSSYQTSNRAAKNTSTTFNLSKHTATVHDSNRLNFTLSLKALHRASASRPLQPTLSLIHI